MKKSFKTHLFIQVILITAVVIYSNRLAGQYFLTQQLQDRVHQEMGLALSNCADRIEQPNVFVSCFKAMDKGSLVSNVSDFYVLCNTKPDTILTDSPSVCQAGVRADFWLNSQHSSSNGVDFSRGMVNQDEWYAVRLNDQLNGPQVWLAREQIDALMLRLWALRDRNTIYVLPVVLVMLLALTLYVTYLLMRPIELIKNDISKLNAATLDKSIVLRAPYKEFEALVRVFEDLRIRLNDSFTKARRFASDASHELRTPLTILRGNVEQMISELPMGSETQIRMRNVSDEVERLIEITEKLLLLSRADANSLAQELVNVNLSDLLMQLVNDARAFQPSLKITSAIAPDVVWRCDKTLVHQLVHNLYANAAKYNQSSGWIHFSLTQADGYFSLTVENPATDIPIDLGERAFDRFYRGDASHTRHVDGLGLGLSICLEIAKLHDATLSLFVTDKKTVVATLSAASSATRIR